MTEVYFTTWPDSCPPKPLPIPPNPGGVFTRKRILPHATTAYVPREHQEEVERLPADERVAVVRGYRCRARWLCVSPSPFFLYYPVSGVAEIPHPMPSSEVAARLKKEEILRLEGKVPQEIYCELLAAKLRET
jgi:hypothetical protein